MSLRCPNCGLFSPEEASRCDCGFDFATKTIKSSYLLEHILEKHGGEANIIDESSRTKVRAGVTLLALGAVVTLGSYLAGRVYFWGAAVLWGALLLSRGLRQRRQRSLDSATRADLIQRS